jgi:ABC-type transport system involved in cytochrome c biogenesis ATPase subunit/predicted GNAT family N-acyltransferase
MQRFKVITASGSGLYKQVSISDRNGKIVRLKLHRYAVVGEGDTILINPRTPAVIGVMSTEDSNDTIKVTPAYHYATEFRLGKVRYPIRLTELVTAQDIEQYKYLEQFHYKTGITLNSGEEDAAEAPDSGGRKAVLLCYLQVGTRWQAVGYVELQMPLLMVKPRHMLFSNSFQHPTRPIQWNVWDLAAKKKYVNTIVRIARIVTSPEFRGLGLSHLMIESAMGFAGERWHIAGRRPLFMEISAEMLKYLDFVSSAGLRYVGDTEGNIQRISKDIVSMQRGQKIGSGIMSLQKKYLTRLKATAEKLGKSFDEALQLIKSATENESVLNSLSPQDWYLVKSALRFPIPYYLCGLDQVSRAYIDRHAEGIQHRQPAVRFRNTGIAVKLQALAVYSRFSVPDAPAIRSIMDCFGLEGDTLSSQVISPINVEASSGNVMFIAGASGSGKSVLLRALDPAFRANGLRVEFRNKLGDYTAGWIRELPENVPVIQYFSDKWGMEKSIAALNQAGLSEAFVYLKPYELLSRGQRYRAKLADLALRNDDVWLIDEFGADLDPLTAAIVARNLRRQIIKYRRIAFVAAANYEHFLDALNPTRIIWLRQGFKPEILGYRDFTNEFRRKGDGEIRYRI